MSDRLVPLAAALSRQCGYEVQRKPPAIKVVFQGKLRTGVVAIGGETTGAEISNGEVTWDLDLSGDESLAKRADSSHKKVVVVRGELKKPKGELERANRMVILVKSLEPLGDRSK
jgi:hypothetical protein